MAIAQTDVSRIRLDTETRVPAIPGVSTDSSLLSAVQAIKEIMEVREGQRGDPLDQTVTYRDLLKAGALQLTKDGKVANMADPTNPIQQAPQSTAVDSSTPPAIGNLTATAGLGTVQLSWDYVTYGNAAYVEIWRNNSNSLTGATRIATVQPNVFAYSDPIGSTGVTRYYWARIISIANNPGPYNATNGVSASTALVGGVDLSPLIVDASKLAAGAVDLGGTKVTGTITDPARFGAAVIGTAAIANAAITNALIANLSVDNAKISNATITGAKIVANTITADLMNVTQLSAITATIGTLRTATSGGRMEISDNVLKVYDSSNVLRVKLGNLSL